VSRAKTVAHVGAAMTSIGFVIFGGALGFDVLHAGSLALVVLIALLVLGGVLLIVGLALAQHESSHGQTPADFIARYVAHANGGDAPLQPAPKGQDR
jgi:hypothetical protein